MVDQLRSWFRENHTLVVFLGAQAVALIAAAGAVLAYSVRLETRVETMETRGAEYSVARMNKIDERLTVLEQNMKANSDSIRRIVDRLTRDVGAPK